MARTNALLPPAENPPGRSIRQTAGDGATLIAEVRGNVYFDGTPLESEFTLDLGAYCAHQRAQLAIWERQYTRLDVDPAVALSGQDLRPVPDSRLSLTEAFLRHERLVVVGGAGAGKTTSMLYLVASALPGGALADYLEEAVPVYLELGRFRAESSASPLDSLLLLVADTLYRGQAFPEPLSLRRVRELLTSHRFLFLLDGLNEAQAGLHSSCLAAINDLAKLYSKHRIVVSSRPHGFSPPQDWNVVLLRELDEAQIPVFIERHLNDAPSQSLLATRQAS
ncbi:MAG: NACHT domain-containing protein [Thermoanaerobaculia bacterium]|nr:NACHT domain-containing protein [Thermoanaerobaculia bacterium]